LIFFTSNLTEKQIQSGRRRKLAVPFQKPRKMITKSP
jgi:hypothetical protein